MSAAGLYQIVSNFAGAASALSGPVAIVAVGADAAKSDSAGIYQFAALVNVNLAVVNVLPLPVIPHLQSCMSLLGRVRLVRACGAFAVLCNLDFVSGS